LAAADKPAAEQKELAFIAQFPVDWPSRAAKKAPGVVFDDKVFGENAVHPQPAVEFLRPAKVGPRQQRLADRRVKYPVYVDRETFMTMVINLSALTASPFSLVRKSHLKIRVAASRLAGAERISCWLLIVPAISACDPSTVLNIRFVEQPKPLTIWGLHGNSHERSAFFEDTELGANNS
jgi:hypothetical protein